MGLSQEVWRGIIKKGYKVPTPIQRKTVPLIMDGKDVPVGVVGGVGGRLDPAVGQGNGERASDIAGSVLGLGLSEVGLAVVVGHAIFVGVRLGDLLHDDGGGRVLGGGDGHKGKGRYQLHHLGTGLH